MTIDINLKFRTLEGGPKYLPMIAKICKIAQRFFNYFWPKKVAQLEGSQSMADMVQKGREYAQKKTNSTLICNLHHCLVNVYGIYKLKMVYIHVP